MSRCFPYPPPGYSLSRSSKEALIESIKLQKEREKANDKEQRKKEKKRDKKEKNKEKKERKKEEKNKVHHKLDKSDIVQGQIGEKIWADIKGVSLHRGSEAESEQRSSLTEEHGPPTRLHVPSSSSDSTENSNKRKRQSLPVDVSRGHGKVIRIRLSKKQNNSDAAVNEQQPCSTSGRTLSKKQNDSDASVKEQICSTSGRTYFPSQGKDDVGVMHRGEHFCSTSEETSKIGRGLTSGTDGKQICSTSRQFETLSNNKTEIPPITDAVVTPLQRAELQYKNLIENWVPPQLQDASLVPEDLGWLFQGKNQAMHAKRRQICGKDSVISSSSSLTLWPHAQYLPEVDLYALPFTVPF